METLEHSLISPMPEDQECVMCGYDHDDLYVDDTGLYGPLCETCFNEVMEPDTDN